tara:strand:- start:135 stop:812 length:678 start_codon:yes stop_codon:yes gene_type:complete
MSRFLTTIPSNSGFYNLGTVEAYPTGGAGPTAYGPTSYFGSDPLPETSGDSLYNPINLGLITDIFRTITIKNSHGGLSRRQTTFYEFEITSRRSVQFTQNYSQFSYEENTNKNTLLAFYEIFEKNRREELPINNLGYVAKEAAIDYLDDEGELPNEDYPNLSLDPGKYIFLITNDIRYLETNYSIDLNINSLDWRFVKESISEEVDFSLITEGVSGSIDFGTITS